MKPLLLVVTLLTCSNASAADFMLTTIGNSITLSRPDLSKGWTGKWGMAATAEKKDYSGQLAALIESHVERVVDLTRINHATLERSDEYVGLALAGIERARHSDVE